MVKKYNNMKTMISFIVCLNMFMFCCSTLFPDEKLTIQRVDYNGNELKTDGYYYCYFEETDITVICFLFRNGIIRCMGGYSRYNEDNREQEMVSYYNRRTIKSDWGVFVINGNKIQWEQWVESPSGVSASINRCSGDIENDTTVHFTESYYSGRNETKQINEVWHFKQFDNKPDSTNVYIK
jgi:hypothetical protein